LEIQGLVWGVLTLASKHQGFTSIGTTKKGIGPAYSSKASRSGMRIHHLYNWDQFEQMYRASYKGLQLRYRDLDYNIDEELAKLRVAWFVEDYLLWANRTC
jgi:adenylosuccinate synthase